MDRIVFIGINSLYSAMHLRGLGPARGVVAAVETVGPIGRLKRLQRRIVPSHLSAAARAVDVPFREVPHRDEGALLRVLRAARPDLVVIAGMGWLLGEATLAVPRLGTVNVHPALLPAYRGAEPLFWQLFDEVRTSGVTVHLVDPLEDHGPILCQRSFPMPPGTSLAEFLARILATGPPLLAEAVDDILAERCSPMVQPDASPTRGARRLRPEDCNLIAWDEWGLERTSQVLRGVGPILGWPRARWRDLGFVPVVEAGTAGSAGVRAGRIARDADGPFLGHPAGKIRFSYRWSPQAWLSAMRRRGDAAAGLIANEKAAWPKLAPHLVGRGNAAGRLRAPDRPQP